MNFKPIFHNSEGNSIGFQKRKGYSLGRILLGIYRYTQILGGVLAERFGRKWVVGTGIFLADIS